jgi:hypothetical protein
MTIPLADDAVVHRIGGAAVANLRLGPLDATAAPPGLSVLVGGTPHQAAARMWAAVPSRKWLALAGTVGTTAAAAIRAAGFDVIEWPTPKLPNHARITHPDGTAGFTDANLAVLAAAFHTTTGC